MAQSANLSKSIVRGTDQIFFDPDFRCVIEKHLTLLRSNTNTTTFPITEQVAEQWTGDFYGLLQSIKSNIDRSFYWIILRMNGYISSDQYDGKKINLVIPDINQVNKIVDKYKSTVL